MPRRKVNKKGPFNLILGYLGLAIDTVLEIIYTLKTELVMVACTLALIGAIQTKGVEYVEDLKLKEPTGPVTEYECRLGIQTANGVVALADQIHAELAELGDLAPEHVQYFKGLRQSLYDQIIKHCPMLVHKEESDDDS